MATNGLKMGGVLSVVCCCDGPWSAKEDVPELPDERSRLLSTNSAESNGRAQDVNEYGPMSAMTTAGYRSQKELDSIIKQVETSLVNVSLSNNSPWQCNRLTPNASVL